MRNSIGPGLRFGNSTTRTVMTLVVLALFQAFGCKPSAKVYRGNLCTIARPLVLDNDSLDTGLPIDSLKTEELYVMFNTETGCLDSLPVSAYQDCINPHGAFIPSCADVQTALDSLGDDAANLGMEQEHYTSQLPLERDSLSVSQIPVPPALGTFCSITNLDPDGVDFHYTQGGRGDKGQPDTVWVAPISSTLRPALMVSDFDGSFARVTSLFSPESRLLLESFLVSLELGAIHQDYTLMEEALINCQDTMHIPCVDWVTNMSGGTTFIPSTCVINTNRSAVRESRTKTIAQQHINRQTVQDAYEQETGCTFPSPWTTQAGIYDSRVRGAFSYAESVIEQLDALPPCDESSMLADSTAQPGTYTPCTSTAGTTIMFGPECSGPCTISIVSSGGTLIYTQDFATPPGSWDPSQYVNLQGIYFVSIVFSGGQETHKIQL